MNTIDTILKIAKVKDIDSFYKKFPSEEAFMAKYGKEFKKAMKGAKVPKAQDGFDISGKLTANMNDWFNDQHIGLSKEDQLKLSPIQTTPFQKMDFMSGTVQTGTNDNGVGNAISSFNPIAGGIIKGIQQLKEEKERMLEAKQWRDVIGVQLQASNLKPERIERKYLRPEDFTVTGEEMFPTYGTGSNVLAKDGIYIKPSKRGTFTAAAKKRGKGVQEFAKQVMANKDNYSPAMVKKANFAKNASKWKKANDGAFLESIDVNQLNNISETLTGGESGGGTIGGAVGEAVSYIPGVGPIVSKLAKPVLTAVGNILDTRPERTEAYMKQTGRNISNMLANKGVKGVHGLYSGSMEDGGEIKMIEPSFQSYQQQELIPIPSIYDNQRSFNKQGTTYFDEAQRIDSEMETLKSKKKLSNSDKIKMKKLKSLKNDLLYDQLTSMKYGGKVTNMEAGGDLQLLEGDARSVSHNPFSGETIQFEGKSHERGGIDIAYGNTPVEVEGGEQATEMEDNSLIVYGDLPAPGYNKKFKNVAKDISKKEEKQSKIINKSLEKLETLDVKTPIDELTAKTLKANVKGATMKQKELAQEKEHLASLQEAINQTADEQNLDASVLAEGKIRKAKKSSTAKYGTKIKAEEGVEVPDSLYKKYGYQPVLNPTAQQIAEAILQMQNTDYNKVNNIGDVNVYGTKPTVPTIYPNRTIPDFNQKYDFYPSQNDVQIPLRPSVNTGDVEMQDLPTNTSSQGTGKGSGKTITQEYIEASNEFNPVDRIETLSEIPQVGNTIASDSGIAKKEMDKLAQRVNKGKPKKERVSGEDLWNAISSLVPYFKGSDVEDLDPSQIMGELAALSDRPEPVWAQTIQPDLASPYEISLQDQKNEVIAQSRAAQRMAGNNPAAQAIIAAQTSDALNKIQGEEFRINQGMKDKTFGENRERLNQTRFQNLQILDNLYTRQEQAKSKTKETLRNALNSISDKYFKNRFENKTLAIYENLYDYRFDDKGRAWYRGRPTNINVEGSDNGYASTPYDDDRVIRYERDPKTGREIPVGSRRRTKDERITRNGAIVKSTKSLTRI